MTAKRDRSRAAAPEALPPNSAKSRAAKIASPGGTPPGPQASGDPGRSAAPSSGSSRSGASRAETALYPPVKAFLAARGYEVKGEVRGCDVVAVREGAPGVVAIAELKLGFSLELVLQGVDRMVMADEVWLAIPATRQTRRRQARIVRLCRLLGFGLLAVGATATILAEPAPYRPRQDPKRRGLLLREHARRQGDPAIGGSTRQPIMTAYRQHALRCAAALAGGSRLLRELRAEGLEPGTVPARNVYGWFSRQERGRYGLTEAGRDALQHWERQGRVDKPCQEPTHLGQPDPIKALA